MMERILTSVQFLVVHSGSKKPSKTTVQIPEMGRNLKRRRGEDKN